VNNNGEQILKILEVFTVMTFRVRIFWIVTPCSAVVGYDTEDGGSMDLWNVGILPQHHAASQTTRPRLEIFKIPWLLLCISYCPWCSVYCI